METCRTIKVKPWGEGQGAFVEINESDFDPAQHARLDEAAPPSDPTAPSGDDGAGESAPMKIADIRDALTAKGIAFDPAAKKADLRALLEAAA